MFWAPIHWIFVITEPPNFQQFDSYFGIWVEYFSQGVDGQIVLDIVMKARCRDLFVGTKNVLKIKTVLVSIGQDDAAVLKRPSLMISICYPGRAIHWHFKRQQSHYPSCNPQACSHGICKCWNKSTSDQTVIFIRRVSIITTAAKQGQATNHKLFWHKIQALQLTAMVASESRFHPPRPWWICWFMKKMALLWHRWKMSCICYMTIIQNQFSSFALLSWQYDFHLRLFRGLRDPGRRRRRKGRRAISPRMTAAAKNAFCDQIQNTKYKYNHKIRE